MERTKVDLKIQDYAPDWQNMSKQELAAVYGRIMDDIHSDKSVCEKKNNSMTGTVKWFDRKKGFGFITANDGTDYFVHYSKINMKGFKFLLSKQKVAFDVEKTDDKEQAINVRSIRKR